jgi:hypothetical protein
MANESAKTFPVVPHSLRPARVAPVAQLRICWLAPYGP